MSYIRKGFTLVEILIVLALIGLFVAATSYLTHDSRIAQKNAERLADNINTTFRTARTNMVLGKGVLSGSTLATTDKRVISIGSNGITTVYGTTNTGTETNLPYPFYDGDTNYKITDISVSSGILINGQMPIWDHTGVTAADIIILKDGTIDITSASVSTKINAIRITAGYGGFEQSVMIDRVMGRSEVVQGKGETTFIIPPPTPVNGICDNSTYESCTTGTSSGGNPGTCLVSATWTCLGSNSGSNASCSKVNAPCNSCNATLPACNGTSCLLTYLPSSANQSWVKNAGSCGFACTGGYTGLNCEIPPNSCNATLPACNGTSCLLTYLPSSANQSWVKNAGSCGFACTGGYTGLNCEIPPNSCNATLPACNGTSCLLTYLPSSANQSWVKNAGSCGFACTGGYTGVNCEIPPNSCNATLPACNGTSCLLTYLPSSANQSWVKNAGSCGFACTGGYTGVNCETAPTCASMGGVVPVGGIGCDWIYTTPGLYAFTVPVGVTSISTVIVGPGAGTQSSYGYTVGGGGGLAYKNNITVTPGQVIQIDMNNDGHTNFGVLYSESFAFGVNPVGTFSNYMWVNGGSPVGAFDGGGTGGNGVWLGGAGYLGGGGAGGYNGNGGNGGKYSPWPVLIDEPATNGSGGGGGGGGGEQTSSAPWPKGGGVGLYGVGTSGLAGANYIPFVSPGTNGGDGSNGGYGAGGVNSYNGAVRIIWGTGRTFPNNAQ